METMRRVAFQTVLRACLFGALAIFCLMVGLSYELKLSLKAGGLLTVLMAVVLVYKAYEARTKPYRKTEMWLCLPKDERPPAAHAQRLAATVLRDIYLTFALWTSGIAVVMWTIALLLALTGLEIGLR
jgi:hypothetical protein